MVKNLTEKLTVDVENHEYLMKNYQEGSRFKLFSNVFFGKMGAMSRANWLTLLFCLPAIGVIVYTGILEMIYEASVPFSSNFGLGYPVVPDAMQTFNQYVYENNMFRALLLIPCIIVGCIGLAGTFNIIKYESLGFSVKMWKTFFKGIKNNFVTYMWLGLVNSIMFFALEMAVNFYGNPELGLAWKIITIAVTAIAMAFVVMISLFVMTQAALYDMPLGKMIKNAFWFTISFMLQNIFILIFSLVPVALLFLMGTSVFIQIIVLMVCIMMGFSYIVCIWTIYSHYVFGTVFTACLETGKGKKKKKRGNK